MTPNNPTHLHCISCKYWQRKEDNTSSKNMGECSFLSGKYIKDGFIFMNEKYPKEEYPDVEKTGINSYPLCDHDGPGFSYNTKEWFGCIHHTRE